MQTYNTITEKLEAMRATIERISGLLPQNLPASYYADCAQRIAQAEIALADWCEGLEDTRTPEARPNTQLLWAGRTATPSIEDLNADIMLDDAKLLWTGRTATLMDPSMRKVLAVFTADEAILPKLCAWLRKNHMRCTQIQNGRIIL